jgi:hypothetical protein
MLIYRFAGLTALTITDEHLSYTTGNTESQSYSSKLKNVKAAQQLNHHYPVQWWDALSHCTGLTSLTVRSTDDISSSNLVTGIAARLHSLQHLDLQLDCACRKPGGSVMRTQYMLRTILWHCKGTYTLLLHKAASIMFTCHYLRYAAVALMVHTASNVFNSCSAHYHYITWSVFLTALMF